MSAVVVAAAAIGGIATIFLPKYYEASTTLLPVESMTGVGGLGSLGNLGNLASLAGVKLREELYGRFLDRTRNIYFASDEIE